MIKRVLLVLCMCFISVVAYGQHVEVAGPAWFMVDVTNATGEAASYAIPTTTIYPKKDRILGFTVFPAADLSNSTNTETYGALYDSTSLNLTDTEIMGEAEAATSESKTEWFVYPHSPKEGVVVRSGAFTRVVVYFVN